MSDPHVTHASRRKLRRARRGAWGFTLAELSVALVAGLIVALAVVGLSKEATNTFHEEGRVATAEMSLRASIERVRADISRASYMSSPNIFGDPKVAPTFLTDATDGMAVAPKSVTQMAGIRYFPAGSVKKANINNTFSNSATIGGTDEAGNGLSFANYPAGGPDAIDITGNLNGTEVYSVGSQAAGGCGVRLAFAVNNPPVYRLMAAGGLSELTRQFKPITGNTIARIVDQQGRSQYQEVCGVGVLAAAGTMPAQPYVDVRHLVLATGSSGGSSGFSGLSINPVLTVRYKIAPSIEDNTVTPPINYQSGLYADGGGQDPSGKFDLYRIYLDAAGAEVLTPAPELIAEYAVDLKFALNSEVVSAVTPPTHAQTRADFGDDTYGKVVSADGGTGPQRIRSVSVRLATRGAIGDRTLPLGPDAGDLLYRYQLGTGSYARVRTLVTEVALNNQGAASY